MTMDLYWQPVPQKKHFMSSKLKHVLREYCDQICIDSVMTDDDIPALAALVVAGVNEADKLIEAIKKHGQILVKEE